MWLHKDEKIDSWDVIVKTTEGRELSFIGDLNIDQLPHRTTQVIDDILEAAYPVTWIDDMCDKCKKCGETICGNDTIDRSCFEEIDK